MGPEAMIFLYWTLNFKPAFSLSSFTFIKRLFSSSSLSAIWMVSFAYLRIFILFLAMPACQASLSFLSPRVGQTLRANDAIHWVNDAIQPSHPLSPPSPLALSLSQHQGLFHWVGTSHQVAKVSELQLQHQSFLNKSISQPWINIQCWFPLGLTGLISLLSQELSGILSTTIIQKH